MEEGLHRAPIRGRSNSVDVQAGRISGRSAWTRPMRGETDMRQVEANVGMPVRRPNHRVQSPRPTTKASGMAKKPTTTTRGASGTEYDPSASEGAARQEECADSRRSRTSLRRSALSLGTSSPYAGSSSGAGLPARDRESNGDRSVGDRLVRQRDACDTTKDRACNE